MGIVIPERDLDPWWDSGKCWIFRMIDVIKGHGLTWNFSKSVIES